MQSFRGARLIRVFDDAVIEALKACGREHETTLFMTLLAAWFVLLNRYSGQDDIVVGSPVANRELPALEGVIGCLINTLSLRAQLAGNPTFAELLAQVKRTALAAFENANVAFDALVERLESRAERQSRADRAGSLYTDGVSSHHRPSGRARRRADCTPDEYRAL